MRRHPCKRFLGLSLALLATAAWASPDEDDEEEGPAYVIFDNTANAGTAAIITNMRTDYEQRCDKDAALELKACNSFEVGPNDIQVLQRGPSDELMLDVGVHNDRSTSYENFDDPSKRLTYFEEGNHLFDLEALRDAAAWIGANKSGAPPGTYGTISWQQFIKNVATAKTMYGIVRVKVPLANKGPGRNIYGRSKEKVYGFCDKEQQVKCGCGPGGDDEPEIAPGNTICGTRIGPNAKIDVRGSLMFDFVDCDTDQPIPLENLPESPRAIYFKVEVPIIVNPGNPRPVDGVMRNIDQVVGLSGNKSCGAVPCSMEITDAIPFSLVPPESKTAYEYRTGRSLDQAEFSSLGAADQYHLLMPSGYAEGWLEAFDRLGITAADWKAMGFRGPKDSGTFTLDDIRSEAFEDIPVYMYTGGLVDMHHHVNISGLIYVPQAMELEQKGQEIEHGGDDHDDHSDHHATGRSSDDACEHHDSHDDKARPSARSSDDDCPKPPERPEIHIAAKQYIMGAIIVRDGFFLEAEGEHGGGATLITNDPDSYSQIRVVRTGIAGSFRPYSRKAADDQDSGQPGSGSNPGSGPAASTDPGPQWVEIRPH